jgi:prephenate dehydrogenase
MGRLLAQDPRLYADIEVMNPETIKVIDSYINSLKILRDIVKKKDVEGFVNLFEENSEYFKDFKKEFMEESDYLIEQMVNKK